MKMNWSQFNMTLLKDWLKQQQELHKYEKRNWQWLAEKTGISYNRLHRLGKSLRITLEEALIIERFTKKQVTLTDWIKQETAKRKSNNE